MKDYNKKGSKNYKKHEHHKKEYKNYNIFDDEEKK